MRIRTIELKNIGPFVHEGFNLIDSETDIEVPPVTIITGENGTGKSIILDSIRSIFMGTYEKIERDIVSRDDFFIGANLVVNDIEINLNTHRREQGGQFKTNKNSFNQLFRSTLSTEFKRDFIFDYWTSKLSNDNFKIDFIQAIETKSYLDGSLRGVHKNVDVTKAISFFDYLKDSKNENEKLLGNEVYKLIEEIINISINEGRLDHISRINLKPIIDLNGRKVSLDNLSSGNLYLIQRMLSLVTKAYSVCVNNNIEIQNYKNIKGLLLIDEAENHLHPKWQKVLLRNILKIFPKLQIIVTTHSPFIVSSIENARVFVCESKIDHSVIKEETDYYSNLPIEEILRTPLFDTNSFNVEISELIAQRKKAIESKNIELVEILEQKLLKLNPEYFNYFNIDKIIKEISK